MLAYATPDDLPDELKALPNVDALLAGASLVVDMLVRGTIYDTDDEGRPTDAHLAEVFRDATVAQVVWADETGGGSSTAPSSLGSLRFDATSTDDGTPPGAAPTAYRLLTVEGLTRSRVRTR